jgi:acyl-CoA reductase-like NAD-dependent aldehyde dehydrogenase
MSAVVGRRAGLDQPMSRCRRRNGSSCRGCAGLNNSVFTNDADRAYDVARHLRSGTVGHNAFRTDFGLAFGGFKQSGIGREGGRDGLLPYLEAKTIILDEEPSRTHQ